MGDRAISHRCTGGLPRGIYRNNSTTIIRPITRTRSTAVYRFRPLERHPPNPEPREVGVLGKNEMEIPDWSNI